LIFKLDFIFCISVIAYGSVVRKLRLEGRMWRLNDTNLSSQRTLTLADASLQTRASLIISLTSLMLDTMANIALWEVTMLSI
jgi:hypothetical protein